MNNHQPENIQTACIVLEPDFCYERLCRVLNANGWTEQDDPTAPPQVIPGEKETSCWFQPDSSSRISYSFHAGILLRALVIESPDAEDRGRELRASLPCLNLSRITDLLQRNDTDTIILGLHAAYLLNALELLPLVDELTAHPDDLVSREAVRVCQDMATRTGMHGLKILAEWKTMYPDHSALFLLAGGRRERCQLLRWMMHDQHQSNDHIDQVLRTALEDEDWEVRITGMLAAARLKAVAIRDVVRRVELPSATEEGVNKDERRMLDTFRQMSLALIAGDPVPAQSDQYPNSRDIMRNHIMRCIAGKPVHWQERTYLYVQSLCNPLPDIFPMPDNLPSAIVATKAGYQLNNYNLLLRWIPPIPHWLGESLPRMRIENPIRQETPRKGFFIGEYLFCRQTEKVDGDQGIPLTSSQADAQKVCKTIGAKTGLTVRLPSADEWEMAARGPDGRRFPWGNNANPSANSRSPWGVYDAVGKLAQWTSTPIGEGQFIVCGGKKQLVCAQRDLQPASSARMGFRIVVEI